MDIWQYQSDWHFPDDGATIQFYWTDDLLPQLATVIGEDEYVLEETANPETLRFEWSSDLQFEETHLVVDDFYFAPDVAAVEIQGCEYEHELHVVVEEVLEDADYAFPDDGIEIPNWTFEDDPTEITAEIVEDEWRFVLVVTLDDVIPFEVLDEVEPQLVVLLDEDFWLIGEEPPIVAIQGYGWADDELECVPTAFLDEWESRSIAESGVIGLWFNNGPQRQYIAAQNINLSFALEVYMRATIGRVNARLYDMTASASVPGSDLFTESVTMSYVTSSILSLVDGHWYQVQTARSVGGAGEIQRAAPVLV